MGCWPPSSTDWPFKERSKKKVSRPVCKRPSKWKRIAEPFIKRKAVRHLEKKCVVIFSAGTGNPFFTTDTAAVLRAVEIQADVILKGTRVNGIYTADPEKDSLATKFDHITYDELYDKGLKIMDKTAFTLSQENKMPIVVFDMNTPGNSVRYARESRSAPWLPTGLRPQRYFQNRITNPSATYTR